MDRTGEVMSPAVDSFPVLGLLCVVAVGIVLSRNLLAIALLLGSYSFLLAILWAVWAAPDVSFTEASVGAGIATILLLALLWVIPHQLPPEPRSAWRPAAAVLLIALLLGGTWLASGLPVWQDPLAPPHLHIAPTYLAQSERLTQTPNVVTAVLADFRGFDTMIEITVIFAAAMACWLLGEERP